MKRESLIPSLSLAMGVINTSVDSSFSRPFDSVGGGFSVGGVRGSNEMLVDGVPNNVNASGGSFVSG